MGFWDEEHCDIFDNQNFVFFDRRPFKIGNFNFGQLSLQINKQTVVPERLTDFRYPQNQENVSINLGKIHRKNGLNLIKNDQKWPHK